MKEHKILRDMSQDAHSDQLNLKVQITLVSIHGITRANWRHQKLERF